MRRANSAQVEAVESSNVSQDSRTYRIFQDFIDAFVNEMWIIGSSRARSVLHEGIQDEASFKRKAHQLCLSSPYNDYLWERFSLYLSDESLKPEYRERLQRFEAKMFSLGVDPDQRQVVELLKQEIYSDPVLAEAWEDMPSIFSKRVIVIGQEVEAIQCYIAFGVSQDAFHAEKLIVRDRDDNIYNQKQASAFYANAKQIYHELYYSQPPENQDKISAVYEKQLADHNGNTDLATVDSLYELLERDAGDMLGSYTSIQKIRDKWISSSSGRKSVAQRLDQTAYMDLPLSFLPPDITTELTNTPERRYLYLLLKPYSCFIGRSVEIFAGAWPAVSPKSVDIYHTALRRAFEICTNCRELNGSLVPLTPPLREAEHLIYSTFEALEARQLEREMAEKRNLELSDTIETELSDTEWMERLGDRVVPRPWQLVSTEVAANNPRVFLADPTGFGKTGQALLVLERNLAYPAIIICPPNVFMNWAAAARQWLPHRTVSLIENKKNKVGADGQEIESDELWQAYDQGLAYSSRGRGATISPDFAEVSIEVYQKGSHLRQFQKELVPIDRFDADIVVVSKDAVKNDVSNGLNGTLIPRLLKRVHDGFVFDESHYLKNRRTKTYRGAKILALQAKTRLLLSATVLTNNADELRNQLDVLGQLYDFFGSPQEFNEAFSSLKGGGLRGGAKEDIQESKLLQTEKINEILRRCCYVRRFPEQLQAMGAMPTPQRETLPIFLNETWARTYNEAVVGFENAVRDYASSIALLIYKYLIDGAFEIQKAVSGRGFFDEAVREYRERSEELKEKIKAKKIPKWAKDQNPEAIEEMIAVAALDSQFSIAKNHAIRLVLSAIERESISATQLLQSRLADLNDDLKRAVASEIEASEEVDEDEGDEESAKKKAAKAKKKKEREQAEKSPKLTDAQVSLFTAATDLFFDMSKKGQLLDISLHVQPSDDKDDFDGDQALLVDAYAKVIAKSRLEGAVLSRVGKLSQITSMAKAPYATALIMQLLQTSTYSPLPVDKPEEIEKALEKSIYPIVEIDGVLHEQRPTKIVFFAQFTTTLQYVTNILAEAGISFVVISGEESKAQKAASQIAFASDPNVRVCACTIGAAREGLNLQVADQAVFCDVSYTAAATEQAEGRIKRLGSPFRKVYITYLITPDSIDTLKVALMERKRSIMLGVQEGVSSITRTFQEIDDNKYALDYEMNIVGGRVSPMAIGLGSPIETLKQEEDPHITALLHKGFASLDLWKETGQTGPLFQSLQEWKEFASALYERIKTKRKDLKYLEKMGDADASSAASAALAEQDDEEEGLINSILSIMDEEPALVLTDEQEHAIRQATTYIRSTYLQMLSEANIKAVIFEGKQ